MDQIKTGRFIATCRKEQGLTQSALAEKLGITDRAGSKWETGRSVPDAALMLDLCHILEISATELLQGEKIEMEKHDEQQEQVIVALAKAKELETEKKVLNAELAESRISTMMSQIRPHFIYNTLGSIEQLCELDPPKAGELVHNFAKYLRGNFGELDNPKPILMSQEMEHVRHYISIENVRFPDMTFSFEMNSEDFSLPALTVQPIVENAIKHGLMKLQKGGSIRVVSYETDTDYCIRVEDDGVGFDTSKLLDEKKHIGIRNIRDRLKVMVGGKLEIESTQGVGTKVLITIPKEGKK